MVRNMIKLLVVVLSLALLGGCATVITPIPAQDLNAKLKSGALVQKTNNFEIIMDTSASMEEPYSVVALRIYRPDEDHEDRIRAEPRAALQRHDPQPEAHRRPARFCRGALADAALHDKALVRDGPLGERGSRQDHFRDQHLRRGKPPGSGPRCGHGGPEAPGGPVGRHHLQRWSRDAEGRCLGSGDEVRP